ncbi:MAG: protein kinase [Myxococcales bacterium]|nr:protein kinase [Myxococcales bacterium]
MTVHPDLADLIERQDEPDVQSHLAQCASCRARARLVSSDGGSTWPPPGLEQARIKLASVRRRAGMSLSSSLENSASAGVAAPLDLEPGRDLGRYVVEARVGKGGMGTVYRVRHTRLRSPHALKVLHRSSQSLRQRLEAEGRAQSQLRHPNVLPVTDLIDVGGATGLIMEFVDGPTLHERLRQEALSITQVDLLAQQIIRGVAAAHEAGIVHRDLKPANVLLVPTDEGYVAKVADFGLARSIRDDLEEAVGGSALGTPAYMAPEQIRDASRADERSDVFSLGAVLYELVTGRRAFAGLDLADVFDRVRSGNYPPMDPEIPARMRATIERALEVEPQDRFASCRDLLEGWRGPNFHDPATLHGPGKRQRPPRPWLPLAAGLVAVALLVLVAPALVSDLTSPPEAPTTTTSAVDRRLTALPDDLQTYDFAISPDGTDLVLANGRGVVRHAPDGSLEKVLLSGGPYHHVDFLDDQRVLVSGWSEGEPGTWVLDTRTGEVEHLFDRTGRCVRVSPDGSRLLVADAEGLWVAELATRDVRRLRAHPVGNMTSAVAWSPSGEWVAAIHRSSVQGEPWLEITSADGAHSRRVHESRGLVAYSLAALDWVADDTLLYTLNEGEEGGATLFALPGASHAISTQDAVALHHWPTISIVRVRASRDGKRIAYSRVTTRRNTHLVSLDGTNTLSRLTQEDWREEPVAWRSPDELILHSNRGQGGLFVRTLGQEGVTPLPVAKRVGRAEIVHDGWVVTKLEKNAEERRWVVAHISNGVERTIFDSAPYAMGSCKDCGHPDLRCHVDRCLVRTKAGSTLRFSWLDLDAPGALGPPAFELTDTSPMVLWDLAPNGEDLALITVTPMKLIRHNLRTKETSEARGPIEWPQWLTWGHDSATLFVSGLDLATDSPYQLLRIPPEGPREVLWNSRSSLVYPIVPSPDGKWLAVGMMLFDDDTWMLEDAL